LEDASKAFKEAHSSSNMEKANEGAVKRIISAKKKNE
jgi:hypothetical protein